MKARLWVSLVVVFIALPGASHAQEAASLQYKVGFLGNPSSSIPFQMIVPVPWTPATVDQLKSLGFNTIQINVAWGPRPNDEVLNLEDLVQLTPEQEKQFP